MMEVCDECREPIRALTNAIDFKRRNDYLWQMDEAVFCSTNCIIKSLKKEEKRK